MYTIRLYLRLLAELCNGPHEGNQSLIYTFRTDTWMSFVRRHVDNVNSSFYVMKQQTLEYVVSMIEGTSTKIPIYFGSNNSFNQIYDLIYVTLKRLYVYTLVINNPKKYVEIAKKAHE